MGYIDFPSKTGGGKSWVRAFFVQDKKDEIYNWLHQRGYQTYSEGGICEAVK